MKKSRQLAPKINAEMGGWVAGTIPTCPLDAIRTGRQGQMQQNLQEVNMIYLPTKRWLNSRAVYLRHTLKDNLQSEAL